MTLHSVDCLLRTFESSYFVLWVYYSSLQVYLRTLLFIHTNFSGTALVSLPKIFATG